MGNVVRAPLGQSIIETTATWVVIPVNCRGVAGAGLAWAARTKWPKTMAYYTDWCRPGREIIRPGRAVQCPNLEPDDNGFSPGIILLASKDDWRKPSQLEWVASGLRDVAGVVRHHECSSHRSVAIPAVGCGLGGLPWDDVEPLVLRMAEDIPEAKVIIYPPE